MMVPYVILLVVGHRKYVHVAIDESSENQIFAYAKTVADQLTAQLMSTFVLLQ